MNPGSPGPWRRLAALTAPVLAAHWLLLGSGSPRIEAPRESARFRIRSVVEPPAPSPAAAPRPREAALPLAPPAPPRAPPPTQRQPRAAALPVPPVATPATSPVPAPSPPPAPHATVVIPTPARLHYELAIVTRDTVLAGRATLDWRHDGRDYEALLELAAPGYRGRTQRSTGQITSGGLAPAYFSDRYRGEQATHFDREGQRIVFSANRPAVALVDGMQDRLSVVLQLAALLAASPPRYAAGTQVVVPTAGTREAEPWTFSVEGEEDLQLPGGTVRALKLQRPPRHAYDQTVELWFAPGMDYAPVRLRLTNPDGGAVEQRWSSTDRP